MRSRVDTQAAIAVLEGSDRVRTAYPALAAGAAGFYMNVIPVHGESESGRSGPDVDTVFYVVAGRAQVVVEERSCPAAEGETLLVRPGERYRLSNAGDLGAAGPRDPDARRVGSSGRPPRHLQRHGAYQARRGIAGRAAVPPATRGRAAAPEAIPGRAAAPDGVPAELPRRRRSRPSLPRRRRSPLLEHEDVLLRADLLEDLRPDGDRDFAQVRLVEKEHLRATLADAAADAERRLAADDPLVVGQVQPVQLTGDLELLAEGFGVDPAIA